MLRGLRSSTSRVVYSYVITLDGQTDIFSRAVFVVVPSIIRQDKANYYLQLPLPLQKSQQGMTASQGCPEPMHSLGEGPLGEDSLGEGWEGAHTRSAGFPPPPEQQSLTIRHAPKRWLMTHGRSRRRGCNWCRRRSQRHSGSCTSTVGTGSRRSTRYIGKHWVFHIGVIAVNVVLLVLDLRNHARHLSRSEFVATPIGDIGHDVVFGINSRIVGT